jgi:hypothetical protein
VGFGSWRFKSSHPHRQIKPDLCLVSAQTTLSEGFSESDEGFLRTRLTQFERAR